MSNFLQVLLFLAFLSFNFSETLAGSSRNDESERERFTSKESVALGIQSMQGLAQDPQMMKDLMRDLEDPEIMKEVAKLMKDPSFKNEVEKLASDPVLSKAMKDPKVQAVLKEATAAAAVSHKTGIDKPVIHTGKSNAALGLSELQKSALDPKQLAETLEMMKDPEFMKEVSDALGLIDRQQKF